MNLREIIVPLLFASAAFAQPSFDTALQNLKFRSIGPAEMGGRIDDLAVVESDPRIIYVGAAAGGIFKSVNGGATWKAIFENQPNPSIGDLALAPSNPSILYVGTGEANNRQSSSWGDGVYKSMDGGTTFVHLGLAETHHIGRIVVHPADPNIVYVAAQGDLWGPNKERGVYKSTDGGATWTQVLYIDEDTGATDIAIDLQSPNILYAAMYQRRRTAFGFNGGGPGSGLYRSVDSGAHWTRMTHGLPSGDLGRCALDVYRKNPNIVYAEVQNAKEGGVYRSEDKGETWTHMSDTDPRPSYFSQIRVDPDNENRIWMGGVNIYMSEDGGRTFTQARFERVHSDVHAIWIDPHNSDHLLIGNDGGVWVSYDSGRAWRHINNFAVGQFYEVAYDFQKPYHVCGGLQDNYNWCGPSSTAQTLGIGNDDWISVQGGDGFYNRIDPSDPNIIYSESQDGNLIRRDLKTSESKSIRPQEPNDQAPRYRFQWNSPLMISPFDPKTIYYGGNHLFKSTDRGDTWQVLGEDLTTNADRTKMAIMGKVQADELSPSDGIAAWPCITAIAESPAKAGVLWVGTDDGNLQMSRDDGKTWENAVSRIMGLPKGGYVSRIEPSHKDPGTVYVTFDNHRSADYGIYIFVTHNYGDSFEKITSGIPPDAGTVHVIREDPVNPDLLFAGTEFGLFVTFDRGHNWHQMKNGLPTVPVFDLQIQPRDHDLILATHGRSIWIMDDISALEQMTPQVLTSDLKLFDTRPAIEWKMADYRGFIGSALFFAPNAPAGLLLDVYAKNSGQMRVTVADKSGNRVRQFNARATGGEINRIAWDLRYDAAVAPETAGRGGRGGGGRGGRGGAAAATPETNPEAGFGGELDTEFGVERSAGSPPAGRGGGGGRGGLGNRGPLVEPGSYTVTVAMSGSSDSKTVMVEQDPRIQVSPSDREKRRQTIDTLVRLTREADAARRRAVAIRNSLSDLTDSWKQPDAPKIPESIQKSADGLLARAKTVADRFESANGGRGFGGGAGAPPRYTPPPVTQKIARLLGQIDNYTGAPTSHQMAEAQDCSAQLQKDTAELNRLAADVPALNKMMTQAGVPYFGVPGN
ncbi:MAG TPA: hypothetical protein VMB85_15660 [Bryobacteraceae bacterium]|nr:hypothetical protein [Bryobacteraceae bacterium]